MVFLLIDNSNSRTKFTLSSSVGLKGDLVRVDTPDVSIEKLDEVLAGWKFDGVMACSVVPDKAKILTEYFKSTKFHLLKYDSDHGIEIDIDLPEQVGADRIANAIGATAMFDLPAVVVDFGTAVTFDVVDVGGVYRGGVIAPGLGSMNDYLCSKTALLPQIELVEPTRAIGKSTVEAMLSGAVNGYRGMIRGILEAIVKDLEVHPLVLSTGGDGKVIAEGMSEIDQFSHQITLEGLRVAAVRTFLSENV